MGSIGTTACTIIAAAFFIGETVSRFRKIDVRMWNDKKFCRLSRDAKLLFVMLLTHPNTTQLGFGRWSKTSMAEELMWDLAGFESAFAELQTAQMVAYDTFGRLFWLPNFLKYNLPANPNVVISWATLPDLIPECDLKGDILYSTVRTLRAECTEPFLKALPAVFHNELERMFGAESVPAGTDSLFDAKYLSDKDLKAFGEGLPKTGAAALAGAGAGAPARTGDAALPRDAVPAADGGAPRLPTGLFAPLQSPHVQAELPTELAVPVCTQRDLALASAAQPHTETTSAVSQQAKHLPVLQRAVAALPPIKKKVDSKPAAMTVRKRRTASELPEHFDVSEGVRSWAKEKGIPDWSLPMHLEHFVRYAKAHGKAYMDWDEALCSAIAGNWARLNYPRLAPIFGEEAAERRKIAESVFAFWCVALGKGERGITQPELEVVMARLAEGLSEDTLKAAVAGAKSSAFHAGQNQAGVRFDDVHVIFRDRAQVLKFAGGRSTVPMQANLSLDGILCPAAQRTVQNAQNWINRRRAAAAARAAECETMAA